MEQKFNNNRLDLQVLREFCEREGEEIAYRKGDQWERDYHRLQEYSRPSSSRPPALSKNEILN